MGEVGIGDLFSGQAETINDLAHLGSVPDQHRMRQQAQTARLVHDLFHIPGPELTPVCEEEASCNEIVTRLAAIQLQLNTAAQRFIVDISKNVDRLDDSAERGQRFGQPVGRGAVGQPLNDDIRRRCPVLQRCRDPHQLIPLLYDQFSVRRPSKQGIEAAEARLPVKSYKVC